MKTAFMLFIFIVVVASLKADAAPYGIAGQEQAVIYPNVHKVPNNQLTNLGGINALIETGNQNLLVNPSFEHLVASTGWTSSGVTPSQNLSTLVHGKKALCFTASSQSFTVTQDSALNASNFGNSVQGMMSIRVKSNHTGAVNVCTRKAGSTSSTECVLVSSGNTWGLYKIPSILGLTSNGISISAASGTGTTCLDDAFVGPQDIAQSVTQSYLFGSLKYAGTSNCVWTSLTASAADYAADTDCATPTVSGRVTAPATKVPGVVIPANSPSGNYRIEVTGLFTSTDQFCYDALFDGTNTTEYIAQQGAGAGSTTVGVGSRVYKYVHTSSSTDTTLRFRNFSSVGTVCSITANLAPAREFSMDVWYTPLPSAVYFEQCNSDLACSDEFSASVSATGVVSDENLNWVNGNASIASTSRYTLTFNTGIFASTPNCVATPAAALGSTRLVQVNTSSSSSVTLEIINGSFNQEATPFKISCQKGTGYSPRRLISGSFKEVVTTSNVNSPSLVSASVDASEVITENPSVFITSCTNADPSVCTVATNFFSADPKCWANPTVAGTIAIVTGDTTASITVDRTDASTAFTLFCHGAR